MPYATYQEYLQSPIWIKLKKTVLKRDGKRCRLCNSSKILNVHHRCYPKMWGEETLDDLTTLCQRCHELFSGKKRKKRNKLQKKEAHFTNKIFFWRRVLPRHYREFMFDTNIAGYCALPQ